MSNPSRVNRIWRLAAGAVAVTVLAIGAGGTASATAPTDPTAPTGSDSIGPRLEAACRRVPKLQLRTDRAIDRLNGDADVRGSLQWLQSALDRAETQNRDQLATVLENRLAVRRAKLAVLLEKQTALIDLAGICESKGIVP